MTFRTAILGLSLAAALIAPIPSHAQGCAQCRDNAAATPPSTQRAYRRAIILLTVTASGIFLATITVLKQHR